MRSATRTGLTGGDDFVRNEGGFFFSHAFGAGLLNISGALTLAHTWNKLPAQRSTPEYVAEGEVDVEEGGPGATATSEVTEDIRVESVEFAVSVTHPYRGDLSFVLISPSGMRSIVPGREADENEDFTNFKFTSIRHYGERSRGVSTVRILDPEEYGEEG